MLQPRTRRTIVVTVLLAMTLAMIVVTGWAIWRGQPRSVIAILRYGGFVRYDYDFTTDERPDRQEPRADSGRPRWLRHFRDASLHDVVQVSLVYGQTDDGKRVECDRVSDEVLGYFDRLPYLRELLLQKTQVTDSRLSHLRRLRHLETLLMWDASELTDEGLQNLEGLTSLKYLHISNSQITSAGLRHLSKLTNLEGLSLQGNNFTDDGLEHLQRLTELNELCLGLGNNQITDEELKKLASLRNLELLDIQSSRVTDDGLEHLRSLPKLKELWYSGSQVTGAGLTKLGFVGKRRRSDGIAVKPDEGDDTNASEPNNAETSDGH